MKRVLKNNINTKERWNKLLGTGGWGKERGKIYLKVKKHLPRKRKITALEIGCANGHGLIELAKKTKNITYEACDFSDKGIKQAKKLYGKKIKFFVHDVYKDKLKKNYDYILIIETLEHINNPKKAVKKYLKYCNERLIVTVPYKEKGWIEHVYKFDTNSFEDIKEFKKYKIQKIVIRKKMKLIILYIFEKQNK